MTGTFLTLLVPGLGMGAGIPSVGPPPPSVLPPTIADSVAVGDCPPSKTHRAEMQLAVGSTWRWTPNWPGPYGSGPAGETGVLKDGAIWDLTGASVFLRLHPPDGGAVVEIPASVTAPTSGLAEYDGATTDLPVPGPWGRNWRFVEGNVNIISPAAPIPFVVKAG